MRLSFRSRSKRGRGFCRDTAPPAPHKRRAKLRTAETGGRAATRRGGSREQADRRAEKCGGGEANEVPVFSRGGRGIIKVTFVYEDICIERRDYGRETKRCG